MDDNLAILMIMVVAMLAAVTLILGTQMVRARSRNAALALRADEDAGTISRLSDENEGLRAQLEQLADRLHVPERTDAAERHIALR